MNQNVKEYLLTVLIVLLASILSCSVVEAQEITTQEIDSVITEQTQTHNEILVSVDMTQNNLVLIK